MDTTYVYVDHCALTYVLDLRLRLSATVTTIFVLKVVARKSVHSLALCTRTFSLVLFPTSKYARRARSETNGPLFSKTWENDRGARYLTVPPIGRHRFPPLVRHWLFYRPTSNDRLFFGSRSFEKESRILTIDDARTVGGNAWPSIDVNS